MLRCGTRKKSCVLLYKPWKNTLEHILAFESVEQILAWHAMTCILRRYSMELDHYELVPPNVEKDLIGQFKTSKDDDDE
jgi:hypothetical protein